MGDEGGRGVWVGGETLEAEKVGGPQLRGDSQILC